MLTSVRAGPPWPVPDEDIYGEWSWLTDEDNEEELLGDPDEDGEDVVESPESPQGSPGNDAPPA